MMCHERPKIDEDGRHVRRQHAHGQHGRSDVDMLLSASLPRAGAPATCPDGNNADRTASRHPVRQEGKAVAQQRYPGPAMRRNLIQSAK